MKQFARVTRIRFFLLAAALSAAFGISTLAAEGTKDPSGNTEATNSPKARSAGIETKEPSRSQDPGEMMPYIDAMRAYLDVIDRVNKLAGDPGAAGVAAAIGSQEILKSTRSAREAIDYFVKLLPDVKNESVRRAIRLQLAEMYKNTNQPEKALEQFRILMTVTSATAAAAPTPTVPESGSATALQRSTPPAKDDSGVQAMRLYREAIEAERRSDWPAALQKYKLIRALPATDQPSDVGPRMQRIIEHLK